MFKYFNDITTEYKNTDFHLHTTYTDGKDTMENMVKKAKDIGLNAIAFTDHAREDSTYCSKYLNEIDFLKKQYSINIYKGIEARISDFKGNIAYPLNMMNDLDFIVASVHRISVNNKLYHISEFKPDMAMEIEKLLCLEAIDRGGFHVLGHCGGMNIHFYGQFSIEYFEEIIQACCKNNIAFELNSRYHMQYKDSLMSLLTKHNPLISFGSDAHDVSSIRGYHE